MALLTVRELRAMKDGDRLSESAGRGQGTLRFRKTGGRIRVYFRFTKPDGSRDELPLGWYDERGRDGWTLERVRKEAADMRERLQSGSGDVRADQEAERQAAEAARRAVERAREEAERQAIERERYTLAALCGAYVRLLRASGKGKSASDTDSILRVHVLKAHPELAALPANAITSIQVAAMIRAAREHGFKQVPRSLRTYLNAAYNAAMRAPLDSTLPADLIAFNVTQNPVAAVPTLPGGTSNRTLSRDELRGYIEHLGDGIADRALLLNLLAGGQRITQLLRARAQDWDGSTLRLWDGKGRRQTAREHLLPLGPRASELLNLLTERAKERAGDEDRNPSLFMSRDRFGKPAILLQTTCSNRVAAIAQAMGGEPFDQRDIRRTCETMLAALGIGRDARAQLLSHGLSGVQQQHYDRHTYADEKRAALLAWERHLEAIQTGATSANVVPMLRAG